MCHRAQGKTFDQARADVNRIRLPQEGPSEEEHRREQEREEDESRRRHAEEERRRLNQRDQRLRAEAAKVGRAGAAAQTLRKEPCCATLDSCRQIVRLSTESCLPGQVARAKEQLKRVNAIEGPSPRGEVIPPVLALPGPILPSIDSIPDGHHRSTSPHRNVFFYSHLSFSNTFQYRSLHLGSGPTGFRANSMTTLFAGRR